MALAVFTLPATARADDLNGQGTCTTISGDFGDCFDQTDYLFSGTGSPLGQFEGEGWQRVNYCGIGPDIEGKVILTDENGDQIFLSYIGVWIDFNSFSCSFQVHGATGQYDETTGSGTLDISNYSPSDPYDMSFEGTLDFP